MMNELLLHYSIMHTHKKNRNESEEKGEENVSNQCLWCTFVVFYIYLYESWLEMQKKNFNLLLL